MSNEFSKETFQILFNFSTKNFEFKVFKEMIDFWFK